MGIFTRYLDTNGDGTGTKNANVNGSVTPVDYFIQADPNGKNKLFLARMIVHIEAAGTITASGYGNLAVLTNGITLQHQDADDNVIRDITDGIPIKSNGGWRRQCYDGARAPWGSGNETFSARYTFAETGELIVLKPGEKLVITINDDLSTLVQHYFNVQGNDTGRYKGLNMFG